MKKLLLISSILILGVQYSKAQTTATDFNCNDCAGTNHDLFDELNAGKVVVVSFVMPCGGCISPTLSAYTEVQNYAASNPGRVVFYISDDNGTTSCSSLNSWASSNGMSGATVFSNTALKMSQYNGNGTGMPKIIVLGGASHTVYFNQNNGLNVTNLNNAITQALSITTGVSEKTTSNFQMSLFPNPVTSSKIFLSYTLANNSDVIITIYDMLGAKVKSMYIEKQAVGKHETPIDFDSFTNGVYFIRLNTSESSQVVKFTVSR